MARDERLGKPDLEKWRAIRAVPYAEMVEALERDGWIKATSKLERHGESSEIDFWTDPERPDSGCKANTESSYACLRYRKEKAAIEAAMKAGTIEILCNKCGADVRKFDGEQCVGYYGLINAEVSGGYWSQHLSDTVSYKFSICEKCLAELMLSFNIPPQQELYY